jgi:TPR repeat protein
MYFKGQGVSRDYDEAAKWYRKAAGHGNANAQFNLATCYERGQGAPQDYVLAYMWFNLAASNMLETEKRTMAESSRDLIAAKMTPDQIAEAQKLSREWKLKNER